LIPFFDDQVVFGITPTLSLDAVVGWDKDTWFLFPYTPTGPHPVFKAKTPSNTVKPSLARTKFNAVHLVPEHPTSVK